MSMAWIRSQYRVPAKRGGRVEYRPRANEAARLGTITGTRGHHLRIRLDGDKWSGGYHPTWALRYLNAGDQP